MGSLAWGLKRPPTPLATPANTATNLPPGTPKNPMNVIIHALAAGEKLSDVARRFQTTTSDIIACNTHKPNVTLPGVGHVFQDIEEGERIYVPVGSGVGAVTISSAPARTVSFSGFTPLSHLQIGNDQLSYGHYLPEQTWNFRGSNVHSTVPMLWWDGRRWIPLPVGSDLSDFVTSYGDGGFAPRPYSAYLRQMGPGYSPQIAYGGQVYGTAESGVGDVGPEGAPDQWNYDECTYTLREGDLINNNPNSLAPYYKTTVVAINALNGGNPTVYAASAGQVVIMPVSACNVARTKAGLPPINQRCDSGYIHDINTGNCIPPGKPSEPCKDGYMKNPDGTGSCIPDPNYKKPGGGTTGGGGGGGKSYTGVILGAVGLLGLLGLGGLMYSKQQEKKSGGTTKKSGTGRAASHALARRR